MSKMNQLFNVVFFILGICLIIKTFRKIRDDRIKLLPGIISISVICIFASFYIYNVLLFIALKVGIISGSKLMLSLALFKRKCTAFFELIPMVFVIGIVVCNLIKSKK